MKYVFITTAEPISHGTDVKIEYYCNFIKRVDDLLEEYLMSKLSNTEPSSECSAFARTIEKLKLTSRFNPQRNYAMSVIVFDEDEQSHVNAIIDQLDQQHEGTIKMIRESGDTMKL